MRLPILLLASMLGMSAAHAEVFRYTDENGNVVYTDERRQGAEEIKVREIPTINMPDGPLTEDALNRAEKAKKAPSGSGYGRVAFSEPENNTAFWSGSGNITLAVGATPALRDSHQYEVVLDGQSIGSNTSGLFNVQHIDRGTHTATVRIIDASRNVVETGQSISFTVHRPSVKN